MWTWRTAPPDTDTDATPGTRCNSVEKSSAISRRLVWSMSPVSVYCAIGIIDVLSLSTNGVCAPSGRAEADIASRSRMSADAASRLAPHSNWRVMTETFSTERDVILLRFGVLPSCRSSGSVTDDSISCGPAPG